MATNNNRQWQIVEHQFVAVRDSLMSDVNQAPSGHYLGSPIIGKNIQEIVSTLCAIHDAHEINREWYNNIEAQTSLKIELRRVGTEYDEDVEYSYFYVIGRATLATPDKKIVVSLFDADENSLDSFDIYVSYHDSIKNIQNAISLRLHDMFGRDVSITWKHLVVAYLTNLYLPRPITIRFEFV